MGQDREPQDGTGEGDNGGVTGQYKDEGSPGRGAKGLNIKEKRRKGNIREDPHQDEYEEAHPLTGRDRGTDHQGEGRQVEGKEMRQGTEGEQ